MNLSSINTPGPGAYVVQNMNRTANYSAAYSLSSSFIKYNNQPGPGTHEYKSSINSAPCNKIGKEIRKSRFENKPGPGQYDRKSCFDGSQYKFGTSIRKPLNHSMYYVPGPGSYDNNNN